MRLLWTYLIVGILFAFGFVCASTFTVRLSPRAKPSLSRLPDAHPPVDSHDD
jgi:hypothetical protein